MGLSSRSELRSIAFAAGGKVGFAVGNSGTILRTEDGGVAWIRVAEIPPLLGLRSVAVSSDGQHGWAVGKAGAMLRTDDEGRTWQKVAGVPEDFTLQAVLFAADGEHGWAAGDDGVLIRTADGGRNWSMAKGIAKSEYLMSVSFAADGLHGWTVGDYGAIYHTTDGGQVWQKDTDTLTDDYLNSVRFSADGLNGWIGGDEGTILHTADGGASWRKIPGIPTEENIFCVVFTPEGDVGWAVGDRGALLRSANRGDAWEKVAGPPDEEALTSVFFAADGERGWASGAEGAVLRTVDGGLTWTGSSGMIPGAQLHSVAFAPDGQRGLAVGGAGLILRSGDGGQSWQKIADTQTSQALRSVAFAADGNRALVVGTAGTLLTSSDGGGTWQKHPGVLTGDDLNSVAVSPDGERGWAVGGNGTILRTTDGGQKWQKVPGVVTQHELRSVAFTPDGANGWAVGDFSTALRTTDGGQTWQAVAGGASALSANSVAFASDGRHGWAVGSNGTVFRSVDGGQFWWQVDYDERKGALNSVATSADGQRVWAVGEIGTILHSSSMEGDHRPFDGQVSVTLEDDGGDLRPVVGLPGRKVQAPLIVLLRLSGPKATGDLAQVFERQFYFGQPYRGWKKDELGAGVYTGHVEVFDGWNVVSQDFQFGNGLWARFVGFMGWDIALSQPLTFAKDDSTRNLALVVGIYCLVILGLFAFRPFAFVYWHERAAPIIATLPFPAKATDKVTQLAGLFLITRSRALDAVVRRYAGLALAELERMPEAAARPRWVAAPFQIEDELFGTSTRPFEKPASMPDDTIYIRGLTELEKYLVRERWWLSIEGPGGVGKSALAFQLARWFAAPEPQSRFDLPQAIPVFVRSPKGGLDEEALAELKRILGLPKLSTQLSDALLCQRRVLALIDGVSEKTSDLGALELAQLNPAKGAALTHLVVMTSRRRIQIAEVVKVLPSPVDLGSMDSVLNRYLDDVVGAGRFSPEQREAIRDSLKHIMKELSGEGGAEPHIPMVFVKLIIQRADLVLAKDPVPGAPDAGEASLPRDLAELVDGYLASLLEARPDSVAEAGHARRAALACIGLEGLPKWRPLAAYASKSVSPDHLETLVTTGLMVRDSADVGDPLYKFALDPIADYLAAKELVLAVRDAKMTPGELKALTSHFVQGSDVAAKVAQVARALGVTLS